MPSPQFTLGVVSQESRVPSRKKGTGVGPAIGDGLYPVRPLTATGVEESGVVVRITAE